MARDRVTLAGSAGGPLPKDHAVAEIDPATRTVVTLELRRRAEPPAPRALKAMTRQQFMARLGADPVDFERVRQFAEEFGLKLVEESPEKRLVRLSGTARQIGEAFGVRQFQVTSGGRTFRHYSGEITIPAELSGVVLAVLGLSDQPLARPHYRVYQGPEGLQPAVARAYYANQVAKLYKFPKGTGTGQTVAVVELGGGVGVADLKAYFKSVKIATPTVVPVGVAGGSNQPGQDPNADGEVMLDVEVLGTVAPGAKQYVYFGPNTDAGFLAAVQAAIHDTTPPPAAVSISWGAAEAAWTAQSMKAMDRAFQDASALGIPVCCASGDSGSTDGTFSLAVDFPASAPHALGCGGTHLEGSSGITTETVWNSGGGATGGGFSKTFSRPAYQSISGHARGIPDVAGNADPATGYRIRYDGTNAVVGGTSAVAPLWAGLITILAQSLKRPVGFLNQVVYEAGVKTPGFHDVTSGNNDVGGGGGKYAAAKGWDACTGLGSPVGTGLLKALRTAAASAKKPARKKAAKKSSRR
jgi:kumamolisin